MIKKLSCIFLSFMITGCASMHSQYGAVPNGLIYEHRTPKKPTTSQVITDDKGIVKQIIPWGEISSNAPAIGNSVANIVQAVNGHFGFPFSIIPELVNSGLKGTKELKEETQDQEVTKLYWIKGMKSISATLPDNTKIEANLDNTESSYPNPKAEVIADAKKSA